MDRRSRRFSRPRRGSGGVRARPGARTSLLFRFDAGQGALSVTHTDGLHGIDAMEFCPADPSVMYLGLERVVY